MARSLEDNKELDERFSEYCEYLEEKTEVLFNEDGNIIEIKFADDFVEDEELLDEIEEYFGNLTELENQPVNFKNLENHTDDQVLDFIVDEFFVGLVPNNEVQQIIYFVCEFYVDFNEGGVAQYFVNTKSGNVFQLIYALECMGAKKYAAAINDFCGDNDITEEAFITIVDDYWETAEDLFPYDELQRSIERLNQEIPLEEYLIKFVRENCNEIYECKY